MADGRVGAVSDQVELFQANKGVLIGCVLVVELVLHEACEPPEFRNIGAEHSDFMHGPQDARNAAALV